MPPGSISENFLLLINLQFVLVNIALKAAVSVLPCCPVLICFAVLAFIVTTFSGEIND